MRRTGITGWRINAGWCNYVTMPKDKALREAISRAGGVSALARELGIDHAAISRWERAPPVRVLEIERITGVSRYRLRPDVYGPEPR
jgi:DNA-binding transcriptional regulator YdaS (Cro superfamily)